MASSYCTVYEVLARKLQRLNMIGFALITVLLSIFVTSPDSDIIVSKSHITASTLCLGLFCYSVILTRKNFMRFVNKSTHCHYVRNLYIKRFTFSHFFVSFISSVGGMHNDVGFFILLSHLPCWVVFV